MGGRALVLIAALALTDGCRAAADGPPASGDFSAPIRKATVRPTKWSSIAATVVSVHGVGSVSWSSRTPATTRATWAAAGPGTLRGLNRIHGRPVDCALSQEQALREMRAIYEIVESETGVAMDFSDVPNILCETDKYLRVKNGEGKPRALYVPGRGS